MLVLDYTTGSGDMTERYSRHLNCVIVLDARWRGIVVPLVSVRIGRQVTRIDVTYLSRPTTEKSNL